MVALYSHGQGQRLPPAARTLEFCHQGPYGIMGTLGEQICLGDLTWNSIVSAPKGP